MVGNTKRIAIIGGGISGTCAANHLISLCNDANIKSEELDKNEDQSVLEIVLFDQGGRGPGGRASHRRVRRSGM